MFTLGQADFYLFRSLVHDTPLRKLSHPSANFRSGCQGFRGAASPLNQSQKEPSQRGRCVYWLKVRGSMSDSVLAAKKKPRLNVAVI